jgi:broad specificity phosphatase PhoE
MAGIEAGKILFVRHGESEANVKGVFAGQKDDSPLTENGKQQAKVVGELLISRGISIDRVISSPLIRAKETAEIIVRTIGNGSLKVDTDERILEYDMGVLTGIPFRRVTSFEMVSAKGAEDPEKFGMRVDSFFEELLTTNDKNVLVVGHGGIAKMLETRKKGLPTCTFLDIPLIQNTEIMEIR